MINKYWYLAYALYLINLNKKQNLYLNLLMKFKKKILLRLLMFRLIIFVIKFDYSRKLIFHKNHYATWKLIFIQCGN